MKITEQNTAIRGLLRGMTPWSLLAVRGQGGGGGVGGRRWKKDVQLDCYWEAFLDYGKR